jgi:UDP-N-acetylglucosamine/UDP-N-acetylgalactosamine diphosphorylase
MSSSTSTLAELLSQHKQSHLLQFLSELEASQAQQLIAELQAIDWPLISKLTSSQDKTVDWSELARRAEPPPAFTLGQCNSAISAAEATQAGQEALRAGKVGFILVAGGQGTRLGFELPKGLYPIGPISGRTLFQMHCDRLLGMSRRFGVPIPMFVMTSPATDIATREYFATTDRCGLAADQLVIFCQGMMPAVDALTGKVLLSDKHAIALSPDGHGGLVAALQTSGILELAAQRGIEYFYYAQVDNPLAKVCQPDLLGYHILAKSQMTTQAVQKRFAEEKVGNVVSVNGCVQIIEYSDLPIEVAQQCNLDGSLRLWAGNIAIHVFDRSFLQQVVDSADGLPFHRAHKRVPFLNAQGRLIEPTEPNATKFERFVFDLLPMAQRAIVVEDSAQEVFAPVKNANGASVDTPHHCQQAILEQHRRWIEAAGSSLADDIAVEISPRWAVDDEEVAERLTSPIHFTENTFLC